MKYVTILFLLGFSLGCNVVDPVSISGSVEKISPEAFANAAVTILHEEGYTVETVDPVAGVVTTGWRHESSYASQTFFDVSRRTRISVVMDFFTQEINVQMTKQKRSSEDPWRNDGLSDADRDRLRLILARIQERIRLIAEREEGVVATKRGIW
ncbi:MAG: hypothetical protein F4Y39_05955 [Gemmatimonadetes bacterium]|nr:hypothetical protein [Gemmatimonadota bacterium]MYK54587.1 hypothetical protein [Gemmatimonadota bacterium]